MPTSKINAISELCIFIFASAVGSLFDGMLSAFMTFFWSLVGWLCYRYFRIPILIFLKKYFTKELLKKFFKEKLIDDCCEIEKNKKDETK